MDFNWTDVVVVAIDLVIFSWRLRRRRRNEFAIRTGYARARVPSPAAALNNFHLIT